MSRSGTDAFLAALDHPRAAALGELFATTELTPDGGTRFVLHPGAKRAAVERRVVIDGDGGMLSWTSSDRARLTFAGLDDVLAHRDILRSILSQWIARTQ